MTARVIVGPIRRSDGAALVAANLASIALHEPWVYPCRDEAGFLTYLWSCDGERKIGFVVRERMGGQIAGMINVSEIVRGAL